MPTTIGVILLVLGVVGATVVGGLAPIPGHARVGTDAGATVGPPPQAALQVSPQRAAQAPAVPAVSSVNTVIVTVPVGSEPVTPAYDSANGDLYVPNYGSSNVSVIGGGFPVTFAETGLPSGTSWSVTFNNAVATTSTTRLELLELPGSYAYQVAPVAGYTVSPSSGTAEVANSSSVIYVTFAPATYSITLLESGLAPGTAWWATLDGTTNASSSSSIGFAAANGTYSFTVGSVSGYLASPPSGSITVNGAPVSKTITFTQAAYTVTFSENGAATGSEW